MVILISQVVDAKFLRWAEYPCLYVAEKATQFIHRSSISEMLEGKGIQICFTLRPVTEKIGPGQGTG